MILLSFILLFNQIIYLSIMLQIFVIIQVLMISLLIINIYSLYSITLKMMIFN